MLKKIRILHKKLLQDTKKSFPTNPILKKTGEFYSFSYQKAKLPAPTKTKNSPKAVFYFKFS
jgi:hypothetical protein